MVFNQGKVGLAYVANGGKIRLCQMQDGRAQI